MTKKIIGAVAQLAQEFFNTPANLDKALKAIREAGKQGADIIAFSECYLGQYPYWVQHPYANGAGYFKTMNALYEGAISVHGEECRQISKAAKEAGIYVVMGCNELSDKPGSETIYNTMLFFDRNGELIGRHRKLMPTFHERLVHGQGDGRDLRVYETSIGNLGGLICWEHHMTLSKYAMATMGEEIHVATWPGETNAQYAIREYATETGSFVLSASGYCPIDIISDEWKEAIPSLDVDWANGGSAIVAPGGDYLVEPVINKEKILYAELDFQKRRAWKALFDPIGHYARPDVYNLQLHSHNGREFMYKNESNKSKEAQPNLKELSEKYDIDYDTLKKVYKELN